MATDYQPMYVLASGMLLQERKLSVITNNLANLDTPSFKKDLIEVASWYTDMGQRLQTRSPVSPSNNFVYPMMESIFTDISQGALRETGNPLDIAIEGEGFFAVRTPEGIMYTRKGNFRLDREGYLVTEEGYRVLDRDRNDIRLASPEFVVDKEGNIYIDGEIRYRLGVWTLLDFQKLGEDFFGGTPQEAQNFRIMQGFLELSNVDGIVEMVRLIEASRAHEVYSRLIQAVDEIQGRVNNIVR